MNIGFKGRALATAEKIYVIGVGDDGMAGLSAAAHDLMNNAERIVGSPTTLEALTSTSAEKVIVGGDLDKIVAQLKAEPTKRTIVLASGDPLFYGTARFLCDRIGKEHFEVLPHVSSMQLAFARVKESWDEAYLTNLATQSLTKVVDKIRTAEKVGLFTTEEISPAAVAQSLLDRRIDYFEAYVCENLGSPDERVTFAGLKEIAEQEFSPLNVMILIRKPDTPDRPADSLGQRLFGNPDDAFLQSQPKRGLLTPVEVRSIALAELDLGPASIVWDVGAGSGSVAIEAAQIASAGSVFAIEVDAEDFQLIDQNAQRFGVNNLTPVLGRAPEAWEDLPDPDAVFVGGAGQNVAGICKAAFERLRSRGRLVVNVGSIENLAAVRELLQSLAGDAKVWMVSISRGIDQLERLRFESLPPTFLVGASKPE
ncbi:MAG: precorrin-6y C5,15-methyltransferase (decarboxylating) subunit CbiE [bacterium]|nr:precorrin-6y C5,15-methyltransferase (decarboxylating) subunit CbiE [bacterium]